MIHRIYDSLPELLEAAKLPPHPDYKEQPASKDTSLDYYKFTQTNSFLEAINLATYGWPKGLEAVYKLTSKHKEVFQDLLPKQDHAIGQVHDIEGEFIDIERYIQGDPECMVKFMLSNDKVKQGNKLQRIVVNGSFPNFINPESLFIHSALIINLSDAMEMCGFKTEIMMINPMANEYCGSALLVYQTTLKQFEDFPDFTKIAFCLCHPSMLRRIIFSLMEQEDNDTRRDLNITQNKLYGYPVQIPSQFLTTNDLHIPQLTSNISNIDQKVQEFKQIIQQHFGEQVI